MLSNELYLKAIVAKYSAYLFDLNGTMINDMPFHIEAWHNILSGLGADISVEEIKKQCYGKNAELLERIFPGRFAEEEKNRIGFQKDHKYQEIFRPYLELNDGLFPFLEKTKRIGIRMGIGSAAIMFNIEYVLDNLSIRHYFDVLISADDVQQSKPQPETYNKCAERLGVSPSECLVFEDAPTGAGSAWNAGMDCVILTNSHEEEEFRVYPNIIKFISDFHAIDPATL